MPNYQDFSCVYHLVGEQPIPVFLSAIQFPQTTKHVLLTTNAENTSRTMTNVDNCLKERKINVECRLLGGSEMANDFNKLHEVLEKEIPQKPEGVCLDITGGTKPMALVALSIAQARKIPVIYLDTQTPKKRCCWWGADEWKTSELEHSMDIADFVQLAGRRECVKQPETLPRRDHLVFLYECQQTFKPYIEKWRRKRNELKLKKERDIKENNTSKSKADKAFREETSKANSVLYNDLKNDQAIDKEKWQELLEDEFISGLEHRNDGLEEWSKFITGIWFEFYVYYKLREDYKRQGIKAIAMSVKAQNQGQDEQDFDVVYTDGFTFVIVECKTTPELEQEYFNKLANIRNNYSGALGRAALVTSWPREVITRGREMMENRIKNSRELSWFRGKEGLDLLAKNMLGFRVGQLNPSPNQP